MGRNSDRKKDVFWVFWGVLGGKKTPHLRTGVSKKHPKKH
eukprot:SAG31_NODE_30317_length_382_cov_8.374558_2_plen_39_part_01